MNKMDPFTAFSAEVQAAVEAVLAKYPDERMAAFVMTEADYAHACVVLRTDWKPEPVSYCQYVEALTCALSGVYRKLYNPAATPEEMYRAVMDYKRGLEHSNQTGESV